MWATPFPPAVPVGNMCKNLHYVAAALGATTLEINHRSLEPLHILDAPFEFIRTNVEDICSQARMHDAEIHRTALKDHREVDRTVFEEAIRATSTEHQAITKYIATLGTTNTASCNHCGAADGSRDHRAHFCMHSTLAQVRNQGGLDDQQENE